MAKMLFREQNMERWVGVRPGHNGTQIHKEANATNDTVTIYRVTAGSTLYLVYACLGYYAMATGIASLEVDLSGGGLIARLASEYCTAAISGKPTVMTFWPPLEVLTEQYVRVYSSAAGLSAKGVIFGWQEPD